MPMLKAIDHFTQDQRRDIIQKFNSGWTLDRLAKLYNVPERTMGKVCKALGLKRTNQEIGKIAHGIPEEIIQEIGRFRREGKLIREIAEIFGKSITSIGRICKKYKFYPPITALPSLKTEYESGMSIKRLARKYDTSPYYVTRKLDEEHVKLRAPWMTYVGKTWQREPLGAYKDTAEWYKDAYVDKWYGSSAIATFISETTGRYRSPTYVWNRLAAHGIQRRSSSESLRRIDRNAVLALYKELGSMSRVAERLECSIQAIENILLDNNITPTSTSEMFTGEGNPFFGKRHNEEVKAKCAESGRYHGAKFWEEHPEYIEVVREKQKALWADLGKRAESSRLITELRRQGKCNSHKGSILTRFGEIPFDSSYEEKFMKFILACENNINIKHLERDFEAIPYEYGGTRHYIPDFRIWLINGEFIIVEIKNDWLAKRPKEQAKIMTAFGIMADKFMVIGKDPTEINERIELLLHPLDFDFDAVVIRPIESDVYVPFYGMFHYLGKAERRGPTYGAYIGEKLIACTTISSLSRNETAGRHNVGVSEARELVRFCIHPDFHKKNFGSWFLSRATSQYAADHPDIRLLVSFADTTQGHVGTIYKAANWIYDGDTDPSYHYIDGTKTRGKKDVWDKAKEEGITESEYVLGHELIKIPELPKMRFLMWLR